MTGTELLVTSAADLADAADSVSVRGRWVRKRNLSKGLVFGDIQLQDGGAHCSNAIGNGNDVNC